MPTNLTARAVDRSVIVINCAFKDEDSAAVVPTSIKWSLSDDLGNIINTRASVAVAVPASDVDIVLSGSDINYSDGPIRILTVEAVYDSVLATGLPLKDSARFNVAELILIR